MAQRHTNASMMPRLLSETLEPAEIEAAINGPLAVLDQVTAVRRETATSAFPNAGPVKEGRRTGKAGQQAASALCVFVLFVPLCLAVV